VSRVFIAASSLGTAEPSLELSLQHAASRVTFGRPIGHRQAVQRYLAYDTRRHPVERLYRDAPLTWLE
jgi:alkylation response protein AidB-like acyl-CoA dehydrogenase